MSTSSFTAAGKTDARPSTFDLRIYKVADGELQTLERILAELALPMMPDYGMKAIGFWADPDSNTLYQISEHERFDRVEDDWDRFHADPRWHAGLKERRQDRTVVKEVRTMVLAGIAGLPPIVASPGTVIGGENP